MPPAPPVTSTQSVPASTLTRLPSSLPHDEQRTQNELQLPGPGPSGCTVVSLGPLPPRGSQGPVHPRPLQTLRNHAVLISATRGQATPVTLFGAPVWLGPTNGFRWAGLSTHPEAALNACGATLCILHQHCLTGLSQLRPSRPSSQPGNPRVRDWARGRPPELSSSRGGVGLWQGAGGGVGLRQVSGQASCQAPLRGCTWSPP